MVNTANKMDKKCIIMISLLVVGIGTGAFFLGKHMGEKKCESGDSNE